MALFCGFFQKKQRLLPGGGAGAVCCKGEFPYWRSSREKTRVNRATVSIIPMTMK